MTNVAIIFGGRSPEHEVSLRSAKNIYNSLKDADFRVTLIGISKSGKWFLYDKIPEKEVLEKGDQLFFTPGSNIFLDHKIEIVFPVLHGSYGEDGYIQGFLKMIEIPFVGSSVLGSSVCMDKEIAKKILNSSGIKTVEYICFKDEIDFNKVENKFDYPLFVKPANAGSSVGVSKAKNRKQLKEAFQLAKKFDKKVLIERAVKGRELECSVLGNNNPIASKVGEVKTENFYSYDQKYSSQSKAKLIIPADLEKNIEEKIKLVACDAFKALECSGMARVDFFVEGEEVFVNEINTIPGFTDISMYPKLWEVSGIKYPDLVIKLIKLGLEKK